MCCVLGLSLSRASSVPALGLWNRLSLSTTHPNLSLLLPPPPASSLSPPSLPDPDKEDRGVLARLSALSDPDQLTQALTRREMLSLLTAGPLDSDPTVHADVTETGAGSGGGVGIERDHVVKDEQLEFAKFLCNDALEPSVGGGHRKQSAGGGNGLKNGGGEAEDTQGQGDSATEDEGALITLITPITLITLASLSLYIYTYLLETKLACDICVLYLIYRRNDVRTAQAAEEETVDTYLHLP